MRRLLSLVTKVPVKSGARLVVASFVSACLVVVTGDHTQPVWISAPIVLGVILPVLYFSYHLPAQKREGELRTTLRNAWRCFASPSTIPRLEWLWCFTPAAGIESTARSASFSAIQKPNFWREIFGTLSIRMIALRRWQSWNSCSAARLQLIKSRCVVFTRMGMRSGSCGAMSQAIVGGH